MKNIFEYESYKSLLKDLIKAQPKNGIQTRLATHIGCQQAYLSRVLSDLADLSMEQALKVTEFFSFDEVEIEYFLQLILYNRAGTNEWRNYQKNKIKDIRSKRLNIKSRIDVLDDLSEKDKAIYYSDSIYCLIHTATMISDLRHPISIAKKFSLSEQRVTKALKFLESVGLVKKEKDIYRNAKPFLHVGQDSDFVRQHHANWKLKAIESLGRNTGDLHYSSVITCAESDTVQIKELMLATIKNIRAIIKPAKDEKVCCYSLDFFDL